MKGIYSCKKCGGHYWDDQNPEGVAPYAKCRKCGNEQEPEKE